MRTKASTARGAPDQARLALREFFDRAYRPQRLPEAGRDRIGVFERSIAFLADMLKRPALVADVTPYNVGRVQLAIARRGIGASKVRQYKAALSALAKHAFRLGLLPEWKEITTRKIARRERPAFLDTAPAAGTLARAFVELLRPQYVARGLSVRRIHEVAAAIRKFDVYLNRYATIDDVVPETLDAFGSYLREQGAARSAISPSKTFVRRVAWLLAPRGEKNLLDDGRKTVVELPPPAAGSVREFFETVYRPLKLIGTTRRTPLEYRHTLRLLVEFAGRDVLVNELSDLLAADFFAWLLERGALAITVNGHRARLFAVWREAVTRGLLLRDPRVKKLREELDAPDAWSEAELLRLIEAPAAIAWRTSVGGIPQAEYWRALLLSCYWTGLRKSSLMALRWSHVDLRTGWLTVPGRVMKSRKGKRLRLGLDALAALAKIRQPQRELIFPWPIDNGKFWKRLNRIVAEAGLPPSTRKTGGLLHKLRRSVATLTAAIRGLSAASDLLGHSGTEVTKRYVDPSKQPGQDATEFLPMLTRAAAAGESIDPGRVGELLAELQKLLSAKPTQPFSD